MTKKDVLNPVSVWQRVVSAFICAAVLACAYSITSFCACAENVAKNTLRLHILANSDSEFDQELKLKVRDALLSSGNELFSGETSVENAREVLLLNKEALLFTAQQVIRENGMDYPVSVTLTEEYFATRSYGDVTLPAGKYTVLRVIIGSGEGHNWWCVMFPPLCLPAVSEKTELDAYYTEDGVTLTKTNPGYEPRFKIAEWYEKLSSLIAD